MFFSVAKDLMRVVLFGSLPEKTRIAGTKSVKGLNEGSGTCYINSNFFFLFWDLEKNMRPVLCTSLGIVEPSKTLEIFDVPLRMNTQEGELCFDVRFNSFFLDSAPTATMATVCPVAKITSHWLLCLCLQPPRAVIRVLWQQSFLGPTRLMPVSSIPLTAWASVARLDCWQFLELV